MYFYFMRVLIIIPCYNEEKRLQQERFKLFFEKNALLHFLFVNDGSSDNTLDVLHKMHQAFPQQVTVLDVKKNGGKAEAIRQGMLASVDFNYDYFAYFDADLATPLEELPRLLSYAQKEPQPYLIMGSRIKLLGSTYINRKLSRHYIGRIFATIVSNMLSLPIYDTQCGAKLLRKEVVPVLFDQPFLSKWLFDVELLFRLKKHFNDSASRIIEVPLKKWEDVAGSKISFTYFLKAPLDLLRIYMRYK